MGEVSKKMMDDVEAVLVGAPATAMTIQDVAMRIPDAQERTVRCALYQLVDEGRAIRRGRSSKTTYEAAPVEALVE